MRTLLLSLCLLVPLSAPPPAGAQRILTLDWTLAETLTALGQAPDGVAHNAHHPHPLEAVAAGVEVVGELEAAAADGRGCGVQVRAAQVLLCSTRWQATADMKMYP